MECVSVDLDLSFGSNEPLILYGFTSVIRPDVRFFCDLNFDPFLLMQDQGKVYGMVDAQIYPIEKVR